MSTLPASGSKPPPLTEPRHNGVVSGAGRSNAWPPEPEAQDEATPMVARRWLPSGGPPASSEVFELVTEQDGDTFLIRVDGEFDLASVGPVEAALDHGLRESPRRVVFDLRGVRFMDLAALMTVIRADERSHQDDASFDVQVIAPRGLASRVFTLTRAGEFLDMVEAPAQAKSASALLERRRAASRRPLGTAVESAGER